jgi:hypothetical protein
VSPVHTRAVTPSIRPGELPADALLARYRDDGGFTDCWITDLPRPVTHADFVEAFYTTPLFGIERRLLGWVAARPSTDAQARLLADARADAFSAWTVEARAADQLLLRDLTGRTRSWLMVAPLEGAAGTRLYFGSAVLARHDARSGRASLGAAFHALSGVHARYSRSLLAAARRRLMRGRADVAGVGPEPVAAPDGPVAVTQASSAALGETACAARVSESAGREPAPPARAIARAPRRRPAAAAEPLPPAEPQRLRPALREHPTREQIAALPPFDPLPLERIVVIDSVALAEAALQAMLRSRFVGFDTESKPTFTRDAVRDGPHVIQFATAEQGFVVQVNERMPLAFLRAVLESEGIVKVGFGLDSDRGPLEHKLGTRLRASVEVSQVLRGLGHRQALGARAAVAVVLARRLQKSKAVTTSNWAAARLSASQLLYAANDAYAALKVFEAMGSPYPVPAATDTQWRAGAGRRRRSGEHPGA